MLASAPIRHHLADLRCATSGTGDWGDGSERKGDAGADEASSGVRWVPRASSRARSSIRASRLLQALARCVDVVVINPVGF